MIPGTCHTVSDPEKCHIQKTGTFEAGEQVSVKLLSSLSTAGTCGYKIFKEVDSQGKVIF